MANACGLSSRRLDVRAALSGTVCGLILLVAACATSGPPPVEYVLGPDQAPPSAVNPVKGRQVVEVRPVRLPEYLDTRDLLVRKGNQLIPSMTGQWAERLSVGMTRALALALGTKLPNAALFTTDPVQRPARQLLVDVTSFEARADQEVILTARWTFTDGAGRKSLLSQDTVLVEPTGSTNDETVVNAMNRAVEALAGQIAASIKRGVPMAQSNQRALSVKYKSRPRVYADDHAANTVSNFAEQVRPRITG